MIKVNNEKVTPSQLIKNIMKKHIKNAMEEVYDFEQYVDEPDKITDREKDMILKTMQYQLTHLKQKLGIDITFMWDI